MYHLSKQQYIWAQIMKEKPSCAEAAKEYIKNAIAYGKACGMTQLCSDGFPHAGKKGQRDPKWDKIKIYIRICRDDYEMLYPNPIHLANKQNKFLEMLRNF